MPSVTGDQYVCAPFVSSPSPLTSPPRNCLVLSLGASSRVGAYMGGGLTLCPSSSSSQSTSSGNLLPLYTSSGNSVYLGDGRPGSERMAIRSDADASCSAWRTDVGGELGTTTTRGTPLEELEGWAEADWEVRIAVRR